MSSGLDTLRVVSRGGSKKNIGSGGFADKYPEFFSPRYLGDEIYIFFSTIWQMMGWIRMLVDTESGRKTAVLKSKKLFFTSGDPGRR